MLSQIERFLKSPETQVNSDTFMENINQMHLVATVATVATGFFLGLLPNRSMLFFVGLIIGNIIYEKSVDPLFLNLAFFCAFAFGLQRR